MIDIILFIAFAVLLTAMVISAKRRSDRAFRMGMDADDASRRWIAAERATLDAEEKGRVA